MEVYQKMNNEQNMRFLKQSVLPEWVDYNGHMNDSAYAIIFTKALEKTGGLCWTG